MNAIKVVLAAYVGIAVVGKLKELNGDLECHCNDECWCKRPGLSLFRWSFPVGHSVA
ncbi:MAG TPA: hypothetical protein VG929_09740 [Actinomycetota bacterium]|nr:hypothetical protein [Actinomycetota bacterium]